MGISIVSGSYNSLEIYLTPPLNLEELDSILSNLLSQTDLKGAIYIYAPKELVPVVPAYFKFHHYKEPHYIYYIWPVRGVEDKVPQYATSIEGVGAIILSPDHVHLLLVMEKGKWKIVTGSVKSGESKLDAIRREIREEVGLEIKPEVSVVGGYQMTNEINDNFTCFLVTAKGTDVEIDPYEIEKAEWFPIEEDLPILPIAKFWISKVLNNQLNPIKIDRRRMIY